MLSDPHCHQRIFSDYLLVIVSLDLTDALKDVSRMPSALNIRHITFETYFFFFNKNSNAIYSAPTLLDNAGCQESIHCRDGQISTRKRDFVQ